MSDQAATPIVPLNQSQIHTWLSCNYQWDLQYRRGLRPRRDKPPLRVGSVGHQVLAALLLGKSAEEAAETWQQGMVNLGGDNWSAEELEQLVLIKELGYKLAARAFRELDIGHKWTTVEYEGKPLVEYQFLLPMKIGKFTHFSGTLDWVARDHNGLQFLVDHKFRKQLQPTEAEEFNLQMAAYGNLLGKAGIKTVGSISHQERTELPKLPKVNQNGSISRALIITDWETYSQFVRDAGQDPADYVEMQAKLSEIEFWRMSYAYRGDRETQAIWDSCVKPVAAEISANEDIRLRRTIKHMTCKGCFVRSYCWEEMRGGDLKFLEQTEYTFAPSAKPDPLQQKILDMEDED